MEVGGRGPAGAPAVRPVAGGRGGHGNVTPWAASVQALAWKYRAVIQKPALMVHLLKVRRH